MGDAVPASAPEAGAGIETKASSFRAVVAALSKLGLLEAALPRVSAETRELVLNPPPVSTWMKQTAIMELVAAVDGADDPAVMRNIGRETARGSLRYAAAVIWGIMRVFGASPAMIFRRFGMISQQYVRGTRYEYRAVGPKSGVLVLSYAQRRDAISHHMDMTAGSLEGVLEFCGATGTVTVQPLRTPMGVVAEYHIVWE
jgi:hypothetical protein